MNVWSQRLHKYLSENNENELMNVYHFDRKDVKDIVEKIDARLSKKLDRVVDATIHGLIGKYPLRVYHPGWTIPIKLIAIAPWKLKEKFSAVALFIY